MKKVQILVFALGLFSNINSQELKILIDESDKCKEVNLSLNQPFDDCKFEWIDIGNQTVKNTIVPTVKFEATFVDTEYECTITKDGERIAFVEARYTAKAANASFTWATDDKSLNEVKTEIIGDNMTASGRVVVHCEIENIGQANNQQWYEANWTTEIAKDYGFEPRPFTFDHKGEYTLQLEIINKESGCKDTQIKSIKIQEMVIWAPRYFTPFSSALKNDEFRVAYKSVAKFKMIIMNRWGRIVYKSDNPAVGWDGMIGNRRAEPGVYFYSIEAIGFDANERKVLEGMVHLIVKND